LLLLAFSLVHGLIGQGEQFRERLMPMLVRCGKTDAEAEGNFGAGLSVSSYGGRFKAICGN
jgi:hypothetical protein